MLYETLLKRRSIRRFSNTPIPTPLIDQLVKSALLFDKISQNRFDISRPTPPVPARAKG